MANRLYPSLDESRGSGQADDDWDYAYDVDPKGNPKGCYEIELVVEKIKPPAWDLIS
jgi:hypothetical protein